MLWKNNVDFSNTFSVNYEHEVKILWKKWFDALCLMEWGNV